jgi:hypothetical protein
MNHRTVKRELHKVFITHKLYKSGQKTNYEVTGFEKVVELIEKSQPDREQFVIHSLSSLIKPLNN